MKKRVIVNVVQEGRFIKAITLEGKDVSSQIDRPIRRKALEEGAQLEFDPVGNTWNFTKSNVASTVTNTVSSEPAELVTPDADHDKVKTFIHSCTSLKPEQLIISDIKWKYLVRSAMRGRNIMMTGPAGTGKTMAAKYLISALDRPEFYFNLGATQDPRSTLIGNTHFNKETGTYFSESLFVKAIQTENAIILLDELSRAHPEAWNILMTVLDLNQRYLRLDEKDGSPTIKVAPGVSFIATANIGNEFTSTRQLDRALKDRFQIIEMDTLDEVTEFNLLKMKYPAVNDKALQAIAEISSMTRKECKAANPKLSTILSTRAAVEVASLIYDGFSLSEAAEVAIYPYFSEDGGVDSERTYVKQIVQKYCVNPEQENAKELFGTDDIASDNNNSF